MSTRVKVPTSLSDADSPWVSSAHIPEGGVPTPGFYVNASVTRGIPSVISERITFIAALQIRRSGWLNGIADNNQLPVVLVCSLPFVPGD